MKGIIDRLESGFAVVETDSGMINILLPEKLSLKEGDYVIIENGVIIGIDEDETKQRKKRIDSLMKKLFK